MVTLLYLLVGSIFGSIICYFFIKSKNVSAEKYETLTKDLNESKNSEVRSEEKIRNTEEKFNTINKLYEGEKLLLQTKQNEINSLKEDLAKVNAINLSLSETNESNKILIQTKSLKIDELTDQITELKSSNSTLIASNKSELHP